MVPGFTEVGYYMTGLRLLIRGKREGFGYLDISDRGVARSFWAILWCMPSLLLSWGWWHWMFISIMPEGIKTGLPFFARLALVDAVDWMLPLLLAAAISLPLKLERQFPAFVVVTNWISVPFAFAHALIIAPIIFFPQMLSIAYLAWLALLLIAVFVLARLMRMVYGANMALVAAFVALQILPGMFMEDYLQRLLGVAPF
ncbi:hypothetical protein [Rhizobium sp. PAMB 3182]